MKVSLRYRFLIIATLIEMLVLAAVIGNGVRLFNQTMHSELQQHFKQSMDMLANAISAPLVAHNQVELRDMVRQMALTPNLDQLTIYDESGQILATLGPKRLQDDEQFASVPVNIEGHVYGRIEYAISDRSISKARTHLIRQSIGIGLLALLGTAILLFLSSYWLSRHLQILSRTAQRIANGDLHARVPVWGEDEIGQIARVFNELAESTEGYVKQAKEDEARFLAIANYTYDLELWLSPEGRLLWINPSVERMLGYTTAECMAATNFPLNLIHPHDRVSANYQLRQALKGHADSGFTFQMVRKDGSSFWASANWQSIYDKNGVYLGLRASIRDIDDLKKIETSLRRAVDNLRTTESLKSQYLQESDQERARLAALLSAMNLGILFVNPEGRVVYHNPSFLSIWMIPEDTSIIGINVDEALARSSVQFSRPEHFSKHLVAALESRESSESYEIQMSDGRTVTELDYPVMDTEGRFVGHLWIYEDVTRERQTAEQLVYLAERDPLTGLYNRHRFQSELDRTLIEAQRNNSRCAVIFFDLDEFKSINDTLGHRAGDTVLVRVAGEVSAVVRRNEILARLGGDEFAILMPNINTNEAEILADRVVKAIAQTPFRYESNSLRLTTSLGIALYPEQAADAEELVARADIAMYQAKQAGKNTWRVYRDDNAGNIEMLGRMNWNERISRALENQHLTLHYHGIYHADSCQLAHVEALVRMIDEDDPENLILPGNFIPMAEKSGRILDIDRWVIREATGHLARHPEVSAIAVNVSARSLGEPSLPQFIAEQLKVLDVKSGRLIFELTETDAVNDLHDTRRLIEALRHMGCLVCLDDFGTGFSSFAYLKHLHADILKIDGMFIRDLHKHHDNQVFVQAIVNIARGLGKRVIAEYVENQNDLDLLKQIGVDMVQGYYLDKPAPDHPVFSKPH